jgi:hypothetical protein
VGFTTILSLLCDLCVKYFATTVNAEIAEIRRDRREELKEDIQEGDISE